MMAANAMLGTPYTEDMIARPHEADFRAQADPDSDYDGLLERYGDKINVRNFDGQRRVSPKQTR